jgi:hypothetical protein
LVRILVLLERPVPGQDDIPAGHGRPGVGCAALPGEPVQVNADALVGASDPQAKPRSIPGERSSRSE